MKLREEAEYYPESIFTGDDSLEALETAGQFFEKIKQVTKLKP